MSGPVGIPDNPRQAAQDVGALIKDAVAGDIRECRWSRDQIADQLSTLTGRRVTRAQIDAITSQTHAHRFPLEWLPAWIEVSGSRRILGLIGDLTGSWIATQEDRKFAALGRAEVRRIEAEKAISQLHGELEGRG